MILSILATINVFENFENFFSLALNNRVTNVRVMPAKSKSNMGQYFVIIPLVNTERANAATAIKTVKIIRFRTNRLINSFIINMLCGNEGVRNLKSLVLKLEKVE